MWYNIGTAVSLNYPDCVCGTASMHPINKCLFKVILCPFCWCFMPFFCQSAVRPRHNVFQVGLCLTADIGGCLVARYCLFLVCLCLLVICLRLFRVSLHIFGDSLCLWGRFVPPCSHFHVLAVSLHLSVITLCLFEVSFASQLEMLTDTLKETLALIPFDDLVSK